MHTVEFVLGDEKVILQTGKVAKQADGAVWIQQGGTVVLVAAVASPEQSEGDFFPLTVDYRERQYAIGKIPGVYGRREPRPGTGETLIARLIDHCIRPLFPKDFHSETQVFVTVFSSDQVHPSETLSLIGASAALAISSIPFNGPVGAVIVARTEGQFVVNPTYEQTANSDLHFFVTGTKEAVMSVEGGGNEIPEDDVIAAIEFAHKEIQRVIAVQEELVAAVGKPKRELKKRAVNTALAERARELATGRIRDSIGMSDKQERDTYLSEVLEDVTAEVAEQIENVESIQEEMAEVFGKIEREEMRRSILELGKRVDGRGIDDIRQIDIEVGVLPRTHGSSLFTRGQTQALCTVTLGTQMDEDIVRDLQGESRRHFFLHYNFPSYSVGEVRRISGPGRREIGHGALAEHAMHAAMPGHDEFPYTVRVVSEILESNASSSMATVCGASLALMDAGVPMKKHVAGVGVGLIKEGDQQVILTDMLGAEDHLGDMDFKVAGTRDGVTAIQLDIKIEGISIELMREAIHRSHKARMRVLDLMDEAIPAPRADISAYAPRIYTLKINPDKIREIIGPGGKVIRKIQEEAGVTINIEDDGTVQIASTSLANAKAAEVLIMDIAAEAEVGKEYTGKVTRVTQFGAFVEVLKGLDGLIHISALSDGYVRRVEDVVNIGDVVTVRVTKIDEKGRVDLELLSKPERKPSEAGEGESGEEGGEPPQPEYRSRRDGQGGDRPRGDRNDRRDRGGRPQGRGGRDDRGGRDVPRVPKMRY